MGNGKTPLIVFQDESLLVLDKPAGMVVNRAETTKGEETVQDWIEDKLKITIQNSKFKDFYIRAGIVHRLDKETSGLLLVAKTPEAFANLQRQFKEREVKKKYLALAHGKVEPKEGVIEASLSRSPFDRKKFGVFLGGREAKTRYKVIRYLGGIRSLANHRHQMDHFTVKNKSSAGGGLQDSLCSQTHAQYSLLEVTPETGRTHQIRVHLKFIGHPIVGDEKYAGRKTARADRQWCPRQFLHAAFLSFNHPITGKRVEFSSKLPSDLQLAMMKIRT